MNSLTKNIFLILILSLCFYNCSSDDDLNGNATPQTENLRLIAYSVNLDEYAISYNDDGLIKNYRNPPTNSGIISYNADNKVIQCGGTTYAYNAQGRISSMTELDNNGYINKESELVYNNAGLVATQSFRFTLVFTGDTSFGERVFEYDSSNRLVSISEKVSGDTFYYRELLTYDSSGNVVQLKKQNSTDGINYSDDRITNYIYDNKINPGYQVLVNVNETSNFNPIALYIFTTIDFSSYAFFRIKNFSNNNIVFKQTIFSSGEISTVDYDYAYNEDDYPTSVEIYTTYPDDTSRTDYKTWTYETY